MSYLAVFALASICLLSGRGVLRSLFPENLPGELSLRLGVYLTAGFLILHLLMTYLDLVAIPWNLLSLGLPLLLLALLGLPRRGWTPQRETTTSAMAPSGDKSASLPPSSVSPPPEPVPLWRRFAWGDVVGFGAVAAFAHAAASLWSTNPDFIYHWGVKAHRFFLARGFDYDFLVQPWNRLAHPDYPFLLPEIFAATAFLRGGFDEAAMLLWSPVFLALGLLAGRHALLRAGSSPLGAQGFVAITGLGITAFGVGHPLSGGPDLMISAALLLGAIALLEPLHSSEQNAGSATQKEMSRDLIITLAACLAATSKVEGMIVAALLLSCHALREGLWRRNRSGKSSWYSLSGWPVRRLLVLAVPIALCTLPWLIQCFRLELFGRPNAGSFNLSHASLIFPAIWKTMKNPHWHGLAVASLALAPFLLWQRRVRWLVGVCLVQLMFYVYVYFTDRLVPDIHVLTSFARILCHVVPALILATCLALDSWFSPRATPEAAKVALTNEEARS